MPYPYYEVLALAARYWFALLGVLIVLRAFWWLHRDRQEKHRRLRHLPDAGMIGELAVLAGSDELPEETLLPLPREGVLGSLRACDVTVPVEGVRRYHLDFAFEDGVGLTLRPLPGRACEADGQTITRHHPQEEPLRHGSRILVGEALLEVRLFAGLETGGHAAVLETEENTGYTYQPQEPQAGDWQDPRQGDWREGL